MRSNVALSAVLLSLGCGMLFCSSLPFLVPNPPSNRKHGETPREHAETAASERRPGTDEVDFAFALGETPPRDSASQGSVTEPVNEHGAFWGTFKAIASPRRTVRILLGRNVSTAAFLAADSALLRSSSLRAPVGFSGRCTLKTGGSANCVTVVTDAGELRDVALPCTLVTRDESGSIAFGNERFRGSIIVAGSGALLVVNSCEVEEYLRGVVPLEIGKRSRAEIEALKAQAVTARTYAYRRIEEHTAEPFDVFRTTADQVYGGADVETSESDLAVRATRDLVLVWHDSLAEVYYHSTCGGRTANIEDVWGKAHRDYLCSVSDIGPDGIAYCSASRFFTWEESWKAAELSKIVRTAGKQVAPGERFSGTLEAIRVGDRFSCGRVKECTLVGSGGKIECGGDKLRFLLRPRNAAGAILRSANFTITKNGPHTFVLQGKGYGHGIGMCQMGAIGRARAGQSFEQILAAYFTGTELRKVEALGGN